MMIAGVLPEACVALAASLSKNFSFLFLCAMVVKFGLIKLLKTNYYFNHSNLLYWTDRKENINLLSAGKAVRKKDIFKKAQD